MQLICFGDLSDVRHDVENYKNPGMDSGNVVKVVRVSPLLTKEPGGQMWQVPECPTVGKSLDF